ncbi:serine hydrolase domain-containing protein [Thalassotalea fusca]
MRNLIIALLSTCLVVACRGSGNNHSAPPLIIPVATSLEQTLNNYLATYQSDNTPGLAVMVKKDGAIVYQQSKGMANLNTSETIRSDTGFRLASVAKPFTALALMQLYEQGFISLEDKLIQYFPELALRFSQVTIKQLLTHQSGIPDYFNDLDENQRRLLNDLTNTQIISLFAVEAELEFEPGSQAQYSNSGYLLIAEIIARVSGISFKDYMHVNFFSPLGMSKSYVIDGYFPLQQDDALSFAKTSTVMGINAVSNGSSGQVSSLHDMDKFITALLNNRIVRQETLQLMTQKHSTIPEVGDYGLGWQAIDPANAIFQHRGGYGGFQSIMYIDMQNDFQVVVLTNGGFETNNHMLSLLQGAKDFYGL